MTAFPEKDGPAPRLNDGQAPREGGRWPHAPNSARALNWVYAATGVIFGCASAVYLAHTSLAVALPEQFGRLYVETYGGETSLPVGLIVFRCILWSALLLLWLLSWVVLLRDHSLPVMAPTLDGELSALPWCSRVCSFATAPRPRPNLAMQPTCGPALFQAEVNVQPKLLNQREVAQAVQRFLPSRWSKPVQLGSSRTLS